MLYLENYTDLSSQNKRQDSQPLRVLSQYPTAGLRCSTFWNFLKLKFLKIIFEKIIKTSYLEKDLRSENWRQDSQPLRVL